MFQCCNGDDDDGEATCGDSVCIGDSNDTARLLASVCVTTKIV